MRVSCNTRSCCSVYALLFLFLNCPLLSGKSHFFSALSKRGHAFDTFCFFFVYVFVRGCLLCLLVFLFVCACVVLSYCEEEVEKKKKR